MPSRLDFISKEPQEKKVTNDNYHVSNSYREDVKKVFKNYYKDKIIERKKEEITYNNVKQWVFMERREIKSKDSKNRPLTYGMIADAAILVHSHVTRVTIENSSIIVDRCIPVGEDDE